MLAFLRRNTIALLALVIALSGTSAYALNAVRSQDIVDGQVKTADLANGAVTAAKTSGMVLMTRIGSEQTGDCYKGVNQWDLCAGVSLKLPKGNFTITITSTVDVDPGNSTVTAEFCPALPGPTCLESLPAPESVTFLPGGATSSTWSAQLTGGGGSRSFGTGVRFSGPVGYAYTETRVDVYSTAFEHGN